MKLYKLSLIIFLVALSSCVDNYHEDPNRPIEVGPELIFPEILAETFGGQVNHGSNMSGRYMIGLAAHDDYQYYDWKRSSFGNYDVIKQCVKMEEAAEDADNELYYPISEFLKVHHFIYMTQFFGDIPYTEAVEEGVDFPKYDEQKDIYLDALKRLSDVNDRLANLQNSEDLLNGDIIYEGDLFKWQKLVNSYRLRILMDMSIKAESEGLGIKEEFREIVENPSENPIFLSNDDNGQLPFEDASGMRYYYYRSNDMTSSYHIEKSFVDKLKDRKDPRLFYFAEEKSDKSDVDENNPFSFYEGGDGSATIDENAQLAAQGKISRFNSAYWEDPEREPSVLFGYPELQFILAEGVVRGWIDGDAEEYYKKGIEASMEFFGIDDTSASHYLNENSIKLQGGNEIQQIIDEKQVALFFNSAYQIFLENRRTGFPILNTSGNGALNGGKIPKRWMYPNSETNNNNDHLLEALERQFGGVDDLYGKMWLIK